MRVRLDGKLLEVDSNGGWDLLCGTAPHLEVFEVEESLALSLMEAAKPEGSTLTLEAEEVGASETARRLTLLAAQPGSMPFTRHLVVADRRYWWQTVHVVRSYNVRQHTGEYRPLVEGGPLAVRKLQPQERYRPPSLRDGVAKWEPQEVLADVLDQVCGKGGWRLDAPLPKLPPVEGLEIDHPGPEAIGAVFAYLGLALDLYLDWDGTAVLLDRSKHDESAVINAAGPRLAVQVTKTVDRSMERPEYVEVLITSACEVRIDHDEDDGLSSSAQAERGRPKPRMDAVVTVPEDITVGGRTVHAGTWLDLDAYLTWLATQTHPAGLDPLTRDVLRAGFTSPVLQAYAAPDIDNGGVWMRRVAAAFEGFRRRYQIRDPWRSRMRRIEPLRVAVLDPARGGRAPAPVYSDWAQHITWRWYGDHVDGRTLVDQLIQNRYANPSAAAGGQIVGTNIEDLQHAPALVEVVEEDQGIVELHYRMDYTGQATEVYPSAFDPDTIPSVDPKARNRWLQWATLTSGHEVSLILTCVPMAPNDVRRLYKVKVTPAEAGVVLSDAGAGTVGACKGPPRKLRLAFDRLARFAWQDTQDDLIRAFFSADGDLSVEDAYGAPINLEECKDLARAAAARLYGRLMDRPQGSLQVAFNPTLKPKGTISAVRNRVNRSGAYTMIELMPDPPPVDADFYLSPAMRRVVQRLLDP